MSDSFESFVGEIGPRPTSLLFTHCRRDATKLLLISGDFALINTSSLLKRLQTRIGYQFSACLLLIIRLNGFQFFQLVIQFWLDGEWPIQYEFWILQMLLWLRSRDFRTLQYRSKLFAAYYFLYVVINFWYDICSRNSAHCFQFSSNRIQNFTHYWKSHVMTVISIQKVNRAITSFPSPLENRKYCSSKVPRSNMASQ